MLTPRDFHFDLPPERIAQRPAEPRDACRLMRLQRASGRIEHRAFRDLAGLLRPGDLLVLNDTRVVPARFEARRPTGGRVEGLFLRTREDGAWSVLLRNAGKCRPGEQLSLNATGHALVLLEREQEGQWLARPEPPAGAEDLLGRIGSTPLPPYIRRPGGRDDAEDRTRYQTVYARAPGAVAAPTAGLHFTPELLDVLERQGVGRAYVTLHVGLGTFAPVKAATLAEHPMHSEWYDLPAATLAAVERTRRQGGRVVAVGTTAVRVLESAARRPGPLAPHGGWTDLFLYPPAGFALTDALITNFHLPGSTLIMLVAAFCAPGREEGRERILAAYREAIAAGYAFYSYGDAMLIE